MPDRQSDFSRRKFLTTTAVGLAGAGLAAMPLSRAVAEETTDPGTNELIYRTLGRTGMKVPIVSQGVGACPDPSLIAAAFEAGVRHFDTAANYQYGANEQMLGKVLDKMGVRDQAIIGTKIYTPQQRQAGTTAAQAREKFMKLVDGSLKRLRTDYVDILYIHVLEDAATTSDPVIMEGMAHVKESGKARAVGVSTHTNMATVLNQAAEDGFWDIALTSVNFTMADDSELMAAIDKAAKAGIGIVGMKVTAGGSGWPNPDSRSNYDQNTIVGAAMKWVLQNENIATIIPGFSNNDMLQQDMAIGGNLDLTDQERAFLGDNSIKLGMEFCRQCGSCLAACPHGAKVPTLMRLHMYLAQYGSLPMARAALDEIPKGRGIDACTSCDHCSIECAHSVNIERRIGELKMIYA